MEPLIQSHADIVVAGGGPAGVAAAIAAARLGADVTLVERYGFLGGMATNGFIFPFMPWHAGDREIIRGIWGEMCDRMKQYNAGRAWSYPGDFDVEGLKQIWLDMCLQAGVKILFHTLISDTMVENNRVKGIITHSKSGREELSAKLVIDCTGDGDVAARAGAPFEIGRSQDGLMQPMTLHFRLGNVDKTKMPSREDINNLYNQGKAAGKITNPREDLLWFDTSYTDQIHFNTTRVIKVDGTNRDDLTRAEIESRRQTVELFDWITKTIPGFEHAYLLATGPQIGIRESRRIMGEHLVTDEELLNLTKFPDAIALSSYPIDIHNPSGTGTVLKMIPRGEYYSIPYRALVPLQIEGLLVAGRPISSTHEAHSAIRVQPTAAATGEAAGVAAIMAMKEGISIRTINTDELRNTLRSQGALVD